MKTNLNISHSEKVYCMKRKKVKITADISSEVIWKKRKE